MMRTTLKASDAKNSSCLSGLMYMNKSVKANNFIRIDLILRIFFVKAVNTKHLT